VTLATPTRQPAASLSAQGNTVAPAADNTASAPARAATLSPPRAPGNPLSIAAAIATVAAVLLASLAAPTSLTARAATLDEPNAEPTGLTPITVRTPGSPTAPPALPSPAATVPTAADTMSAYRTINTYVRSWAMPSKPSAANLPLAEGCAITLRLDGKIIGRATTAGLGIGTDDRLTTIYNAMLKAFAEADRRMPIENDASRAENTKRLAERVMISLELCGSMLPVKADTHNDLDTALDPGIDGIAVRIGGRIAAMSAGSMLAANLTPGEAVKPLIAQLLDDPQLSLETPAALTKARGAVFLKFRSTHLAQPAPGAEPVFLQRGAALASMADVGSVDRLRAFAASLADNLMARAYPGVEPLGMTGTHLPWLGRSEPAIAGPTEQAVAAFALARFAQLAPTTSPTPAATSTLAAQTFAIKLTTQLAAVHITEQPPYDAPDSAAAFTLIASLLQNKLTLSRSEKTFADTCHAATVMAATARPADTDLPGVSALVALALSLSPTATDRQTAAKIGTTLKAAAKPDTLSAVMPWLGWLETKAFDPAASTSPASPTPISIPIASAPLLRQWRTALWQRQLRFDSPDADGTSIGGLVLGGAADLPTWRTAQAVAFAATMLRYESLTPAAERPAEIARLIAAARFLRQLQLDNSAGWMATDINTARGGIRLSMWDSRSSVEATAMTLLAITETIASLEAIAATK